MDLILFFVKFYNKVNDRRFFGHLYTSARTKGRIFMKGETHLKFFLNLE
jgi:hypothetical protein